VCNNPGKRRREAFDFLGGAVIKKQLAEGVPRKRVGLMITTGAPARQHSKLIGPNDATVGEVTSGGFSPCLGKNIAMGAQLTQTVAVAHGTLNLHAVSHTGYVDNAFSKAGTALKVEVRGKINDAVVTKMPFVQTHYYKG
jgi:aminomethyltransferase